MTGAEYRTLREALGLTAAAAAAYHGVAQDRTIRYWEAGRNQVPDGAAAELFDLDRRIERAVVEAVALYREQRAEFGEPPAVELYRYRDPDVYTRARPGREGLPAGAHGVLVDRTRRALEAAGARVTIVYSDIPRS